MTKNLILGTAGHIDHGKSSLIRVLTGTDPDRLPEEKKRGITIELGYATLDLGEFHLGIVDVPGHEKFVRQMLAGATGMDMAMLVVAADDSIKQQTREHLDILRLLNLNAGLIALTKIDLVERDWLELVEQEIRELVKGTFLENAPIVRVSSKTGEGLDSLRAAIEEVARKAALGRDEDDQHAPFRMAIDRSFAIEGFGSVVTGSVSSGRINVGDVVELQPSCVTARVRGLQNHDLTVDTVSRGQRAAINLSGLHHDEIPRGNELASVGHLKPTEQLAVELYALPSLERPIKDRSRVHFHLGTCEIAGNLRLPPSKKELAAGESGVAIIFLSEPVVATWGQPFVIRLESPVLTLGGGRVIFPNRLSSARPSNEEWEFLTQAKSNDVLERAGAAVYLGGFSNWKATDLIRWTGFSQAAELCDRLAANKTLIKIPLTKERTLLVHTKRIDEIGAAIESNLQKLHHEYPLRLGHPLTELQHRFDYLPDLEIFRMAIKRLAEDKRIVLAGKTVALEGHGPKLSKGERLLFDELLERIRAAGLTPPTPKELAASTTKNRESVPQLIKLAVDSGQLIDISSEWLIHNEVWESTLQKLKNEFAAKSTLTVADIRTLLDISRKFAVPLCEYLDKIGMTTRDGDNRRLVSPVHSVADQVGGLGAV